jgi:hypothetical protein
MKKKTKVPKVYKKEERVLPREIVMLQNVHKTMLSTSILMHELIGRLIYKMR